MSSSENPLVKVEQSVPTTVSNNASTEAMFTSRLQLLQSMSEVIKGWKAEDHQEVEKPSAGEFWLGPPGGQSLSREFRAICISWRDHALRLKANEAELESYCAPTKGFPPKNDEESIFNKISSSPKQQKDGAKLITNMWGKDILVWVPFDQTTGKFAIYFMHSTARPEAVNAFNNRGKLLILRSQLVETASFSWYTPEIRVYPHPIEVGSIKLPTEEEVREELTKFLNPIPRGEGRTTVIDGQVR